MKMTSPKENKTKNEKGGGGRGIHQNQKVLNYKFGTLKTEGGVSNFQNIKSLLVRTR